MVHTMMMRRLLKKLQLDSPSDMDSFETLLTAVQKNYSKELVAKIIDDFKRNDVIQKMGIPDEIS